MLQILLSWFFIGFIYLTVGSLCMNFLSRYCSIVERYNVVDRLILGLSHLLPFYLTGKLMETIFYSQMI